MEQLVKRLKELLSSNFTKTFAGKILCLHGNKEDMEKLYNTLPYYNIPADNTTTQENLLRDIYHLNSRQPKSANMMHCLEDSIWRHMVMVAVSDSVSYLCRNHCSMTWQNIYLMQSTVLTRALSKKI